MKCTSSAKSMPSQWEAHMVKFPPNRGGWAFKIVVGHPIMKLVFHHHEFYLVQHAQNLFSRNFHSHLLMYRYDLLIDCFQRLFYHSIYICNLSFYQLYVHGLRNLHFVSWKWLCLWWVNEWRHSSTGFISRNVIMGNIFLPWLELG